MGYLPCRLEHNTAREGRNAAVVAQLEAAARASLASLASTVQGRLEEVRENYHDQVSSIEALLSQDRQGLSSLLVCPNALIIPW